MWRYEGNILAQTRPFYVLVLFRSCSSGLEGTFNEWSVESLTVELSLPESLATESPTEP